MFCFPGSLKSNCICPYELLQQKHYEVMWWGHWLCQIMLEEHHHHRSQRDVYKKRNGWVVLYMHCSHVKWQTWVWLLKSRLCTVPIQVSALHQTKCLAQMKDESLSFMWGNEVQSRVLCLKLSNSVFVEAGWVHVWVGSAAAGQLRGGSAWQHRPLFLTGDARTGTPRCFDPRVSWITYRSLQSCDYEAQSCTQEDVIHSLRTKHLFEFPCNTIYRDFIILTSSISEPLATSQNWGDSHREHRATWSSKCLPWSYRVNSR